MIDVSTIQQRSCGLIANLDRLHSAVITKCNLTRLWGYQSSLTDRSQLSAVNLKRPNNWRFRYHGRHYYCHQAIGAVISLGYSYTSGVKRAP